MQPALIKPMANELTKNLQVCFFLAYFGTWGNGTKVQYSKPAEVAFPMLGSPSAWLKSFRVVGKEKLLRIFFGPLPVAQV